ncbi:MAG: hypothetical protein M3Q14_00075 [bacterium]|nr:hypothetical protein [bacterium]
MKAMNGEVAATDSVMLMSKPGMHEFSLVQHADTSGLIIIRGEQIEGVQEVELPPVEFFTARALFIAVDIARRTKELTSAFQQLPQHPRASHNTIKRAVGVLANPEIVPALHYNIIKAGKVAETVIWLTSDSTDLGPSGAIALALYTRYQKKGDPSAAKDAYDNFIRTHHLGKIEPKSFVNKHLYQLPKATTATDKTTLESNTEEENKTDKKDETEQFILDRIALQAEYPKKKAAELLNLKKGETIEVEKFIATINPPGWDILVEREINQLAKEGEIEIVRDKSRHRVYRRPNRE